MVAVDTNVLVRLLTRDHESQYRRAHRLFKQNDIFIPETVIQETEWVLRYAYEFGPDTICGAFERLFGLENVHLTNPRSVSQAIEWHRAGLDLSDAMHLAGSQSCDTLYTFDAPFVRDAKGRSRCDVLKP